MMKPSKIFLLIIISIFLTGYSLLQVNKIKPSSTNEEEAFAYSLDMDKNYAIAGAPIINTYLHRGGSVYLYERHGQWIQKSRIKHWDEDAYNGFGTDVGIAGNYAVVGAPTAKLTYGISCGAAYVYHRKDGEWIQQVRLDGETPNQGVHFGQAVAIHGNYIIIGAHDYDGATGVAFIYKRNGEEWELQFRIKGSDVKRGDQFGSSVSIYGEYAAVGASHADNGRGSVYIFKRIEDQWLQFSKLNAEAKSEIAAVGNIQQKMTEAADAKTGRDISSRLNKEVINSEADYFGFALDMHRGKIIIGAPGHDYDNYDGHDEGTAYIFDLASSKPIAKLRNSEAIKGNIITPQYAFGSSVAIWKNKSLVGAIGSGSKLGMTGGAYAYTDARETHFYLPMDVNGDVGFGQAVALSNNCPWIGAPAEGYEINKIGAIYDYCLDK